VKEREDGESVGEPREKEDDRGHALIVSPPFPYPSPCVPSLPVSRGAFTSQQPFAESLENYQFPIP
jgi:hypothetical protein